MRSFDVGEVDEYFWSEFQIKGIVSGVIVRDSETELEYDVEFVTPYTLNESAEDELSRSPVHVVRWNTIVVPDITPEHLQQAIDVIRAEGLIPRPTS